jgi:hypothetical protein
MPEQAKIALNWEYSSDAEIKSLVFALRSIQNGFYKQHNFYVDYYDPQNARNKQNVIIPEIDYLKLPRFWQKIALTKGNIAEMQIDDELREFLEKELEKFQKKPQMQSLRQIVETDIEKIITTILEVLQLPSDSLSKITVRPARFGPFGSFNPVSEKKEIVIFLREEAPLEKFASLLINALVRDRAYELKAEWNELRLLVDYFLTTPKINALTKTKNMGILTILRSPLRGNEAERTKQIYEEIGLAYNKVEFKIMGNTIYSGDQALTDLTENEAKILTALINEKDKILTYDAIGEIIFDTENDFSLEAITKNMQRLRDKLEQNNLSATFIQTIPKKGYYLAT